jgi:beta-phosphoglucomutase-like phosphatase (HAD superfamily)
MSLPAAVLWDMDGTLVDTEPYWIAAEHDIVEEHGGTWTEELAHQLVGQDLLVAATFIRDNSAVDWSPERIVDEMLGRVIGKVSEHIPWRPGARELLEALKAEGVPSALVTMSWRSLADAVLGALPEGTFDVVVTGDEVSHGKPHPEPYRAAARLLGVSPGTPDRVPDVRIWPLCRYRLSRGFGGVEAGDEFVVDLGSSGLAFGAGVVALGEQCGAELDGGLEEGAGFADRLVLAVHDFGSGAVAVAEHAGVFAVEPCHVRSEGVGG